MSNADRDVFKEEVRQANRLEDVIPALTGRAMKGEGTEQRVLCEFHDDHDPSLRVNTEKQVFICDACGAKGDVFGFVEQLHDCDFPAALRELADRAGITKPAPPKKRRAKPATAPTKGGGGGGGSPRKPLEDSNTSVVNTPVEESNTPVEDSNPPPAGLTLAQYAAAKGLPEQFLRDLDVSEIPYPKAPAVRIPYFDLDGSTERAVQFRIGRDKQGPGGRFKWKKGSKPCPYGLERLSAARARKQIVLVEGASDTQTLWFHDISALGLPSASAKLEEYELHLAGIDRIEVVIEPDAGGEAVRAAIARAPFRDRVWLVILDGAKDPSALFLRDKSNFKESWAAASKAARKWSDVAADARGARAMANLPAARRLLDNPDLMALVGEVIAERGHAGDVRPAKLAYLAMTSRLQEQPISMAFVAQSASGKNHAVNAAKELMPEDAIHEISASSERALIYDDVDLEHKVVLFTEADSIPEDGPAASAIRSLVTDNAMAYDTVEKVDGHFQTRHIRKPGPTGLITTSTKRLPDQMSTRTLEVPIPDDETQTLAVLKVQAAAAQALHDDRPGVADFVACQRWLQDAGCRKVVIPYADVLAGEVPTQAVRMRRDFPQLLACIKAVAFLHQRQRKTDQGHIVATLEDYEVARDLLAPIFDVIVADGCTPAVRETVDAVKPKETISGADLARRLKIAPSTLSYRVKRALAGGWLVNEEERRGQPARYTLGTPLPDVTSALPATDKVRDLFEGSNGNQGDGAPPPPSYKDF